MTKLIEYISFILILILPITLITGPALPDISISLVGAYFLLCLIYKKKYNFRINEPWIKISIFFWFFLIFISVFAENKYLAYRDTIIFIRILFIPIFMYLWLLNSNKKIIYLCGIVFLSVIFVSLDSIYQYINYNPEIGFGNDIFGFRPESQFYGRLSGPFNDLIPGAYVSKFALIGLIFIFEYFQEKKQILLSILYLSLAGIITYISGERMAFATFLLALFFLMFFFTNKRIIFFISILFIIFSIVSLNKIHPIYNDYSIIESSPFHLGLKIEKTYNCNKQEERKCKKIINVQPEFMKVIKNFHHSSYGQIYALGIKMWKDHPIQGIGLNNFYYLCKNDKRYINSIKKYISPSEFEITDCVSHPHNIYLQWLVEAGLFGLIFFILYILSLIYFILIKNLNPYKFIALANILILFWPIMSTGSLLKNWMGVSTFFIIGISLSLVNLKKNIE